jgi:hypothetical protein
MMALAEALLGTVRHAIAALTPATRRVLKPGGVLKPKEQHCHQVRSPTAL